MGKTIATERYSDTGFGLKDTSAEINALIYTKLMKKSGEERLEMGSSMLAAAKEMIIASLPTELSEEERRVAVYERIYSEPLPKELSGDPS